MEIRKRIVLKNKKAAAVRRFHPWVFSGAVKAVEGAPSDGDVVEVNSENGEYLATGHYQEGSIMVRLFAFQPITDEGLFWEEKIRNALLCRRQAGLIDAQDTNCYRLVHAEGDGLPGLIIDIYGGAAVLQCHSIGMHRSIPAITQALRTVLGEQLTTIFDKSADSLPAVYAGGVQNSYLMGEAKTTVVRENGHSFYVDWEEGQKTGFFLDQRENRQLLGRYAPGRKVLNAFCYSGGFSVYALKAGASSVDSVDASRKAMGLLERNLQLNDLASRPHSAYVQDVMAFLRQADPDYELMAIDPPAFAKSLKKRHNAVQAYKRLNALALQKLKPGGILFTFSCSQVVDKALFYHTIVAAVLESGRSARVLHRLSQPPDHPVSIFHPEGEYLKGLVLYVE